MQKGRVGMIMIAVGIPAWTVCCGAGEQLTPVIPRSVADVCDQYPDRVRALFHALDLDAPGLEITKKAFQENALPAACKTLLKFYRDGRSGVWLHHPQPSSGNGHDKTADAVCEDRLTFYGHTAVVPRRQDGHLQWDYSGPARDVEWALALNRHYHLDTLLKAYRQTGNPKYVAKIDACLRDWITASWPYPKKKNSSVMWRGLEVSFRVKAWALVPARGPVPHVDISIESQTDSFLAVRVTDPQEKRLHIVIPIAVGQEPSMKANAIGGEER